MKPLLILLTLACLSLPAFAVTWSWTDSTDTAATYSIYEVTVSPATALSVCPANPTYSLLVKGLAAGTTSYQQTGTPGTLYCAVATATDPTTGLESVYSNQASVFLPSAPSPPTNFAGKP